MVCQPVMCSSAVHDVPHAQIYTQAEVEGTAVILEPCITVEYSFHAPACLQTDAEPGRLQLLHKSTTAASIASQT